MRGDKKNYPVSLVWLLVATFIAIAFANAAWSSDRITQSNDQNLQTTGDVSMGTGDAFGVAGGDVDLAQCYRSFNYFIVWQDSKPNPLCLAQQLMAEGNYEAAATLRCQPWSVSKAFGGKESCIAALSVPPPAPVVMEPVIDDHLDDEEEWHEEQMQLQQDYDERLAQLEDRFSRPAPKPQIIEQTVQQPYLSDAKKAALAELIE